MPAASWLLPAVLVTTPPMNLHGRGMIRETLEEITTGVVAAGRPARFTVRFAVGRPPKFMKPRLRPRLRALLVEEQRIFGDLALLNMTDGSCNDGKTWHTFEWAAREFPAADLVFKIDDDTVVDWRLALARILRRAVRERPATLPLRGLYVGTLAANYSCSSVLDGREPCAAGALYGFSMDIVRWIVEHEGPSEGYEDMEACLWARRFERAVLTVGGRLKPWGLLEALRGQIGGAWAHPVKDPELFETCYKDRERGCFVYMFPDSRFPALLHFQMPRQGR